MKIAVLVSFAYLLAVCEAGFFQLASQDRSLKDGEVMFKDTLAAPASDKACDRGLIDPAKKACCSPHCWQCADHPDCGDSEKYFKQTGQNNTLCCVARILERPEYKMCDKSLAPCRISKEVQKKWKADLALPINEERHKRNRRIVKQREFRAKLFEEIKVNYDFAWDTARGVKKLCALMVEKSKIKIKDAQAKLGQGAMVQIVNAEGISEVPTEEETLALGKVAVMTNDTKAKGPARDYRYQEEIEMNQDKVRFYGQILRNSIWVMGNATEGLNTVDVMKVKIQTDIEKIDEYGPKVNTLHDDSIRVHEDAKKLMKQWKNAANTYFCTPRPQVQHAKYVCTADELNTAVRKCKVECEEGYDSKKSKNTIRCLKQGKFGKELYGELSGVATCVGRNCGKPPEIAKAQTVIQDIIFPNKAAYTCFEGHSVDGSAGGAKSFDIPCGTKGKLLTKEEHQCKPIRCGKATEVKHSKILNYKATYVFTNVVHYECLTGYTSDGLAGGPKKFEINCQATGQFTEALQCKPVLCGPIPAYVNTKMLTQGVKGDQFYPQKLEYKCDTGYTLDQKCGGDSAFNLACHPNGEYVWEGHIGEPIPICRPVSAGMSPTLPNADYQTREMFFKEQARVVAAVGYSLVSHPDKGLQFVFSATADCKFSGVQEFKPVSCGAPPTVANSKPQFNKANAVFGDILSYDCTDGYSTDKTQARAAKNFTVTCEADSSFSKIPGVGECVNIDDCADHTCGPHGHCVDKLKNYSCVCQDGFQEVYDNKTDERVCGNIDDCGPDACGVGECKDGVNDYECICPEGYELFVHAEGKTCKAVTCGTPPRVPKALTQPIVLQTTKAYYKEHVLYHCDEGHTLDAKHAGLNHFKVQCQANKKFTDTKACKPIECGPAPRVANAELDVEAAVYNQTVKYECKEGYSIDSTPNGDKHFFVKCQVTGDYGLPLECKPITCGEPDQVANAQRSSGKRFFKDVVQFSCFEGFTIDGKPESKAIFEATCQANGKFTSLETCNPKVCGHPPSKIAVLHATVPDLGHLHFPQVAEITCRDGYTIGGDPKGATTFTVACLATGKFAAHNKDDCKPVKCGAALPMPNATLKEVTDAKTGKVIDTKNMHFGLEAEYTCNEGFTAGGEHEAPKKIKVECRSSGEFATPALDLQCRNVNDCDRHTCGAHGTCVDLVGKAPAYTCKCQFGFDMTTTPTGEKICGNIDDCGKRGCGPGVCRDLVGDYTCICPSGHYLGMKDGEKTCLPVQCADKVPEVANAVLVGDKKDGTLVFPETIRYECKEGYSSDSSPLEAKRKFQASCKAHGVLMGMQQCQPVSCGSPHVFAYTQLVFPPNKRHVMKFGEKNAKYKCFEGYTILGKKGGRTEFDSACAKNGIMGDPEVCEPVKCGRAPRVPKARANLAGEVVFGQTVQYECDKGHTLTGGAHGAHHFEAPCNKEGNFEAITAVCKPVKAGLSPAIEGARLLMVDGKEIEGNERVELFYPQGVEYQCKPGYTLNGGPSGQIKFVSLVTSNGQFNPALPPKCKPITFTIKGEVKNARTGAGVSGASVTLVGTDGKAVSDTGFFTLTNVIPGKLKLLYKLDGFIDLEKEIEIEADVHAGGLADVNLSPKMQVDQWRAALKWGEYPEDLDTYVKWGTQTVAWYNMYVNSGSIAAKLEVDDTDGIGPETAYISRVGRCDGGAFKCDIKYMINDYTESGDMPNKEASVTLYNGDRVAGQWNIKNCPKAVSEDKNWWHVFTIDAKTNKLKWHCGQEAMLLGVGTGDNVQLLNVGTVDTEQQIRSNFDRYVGPFPGRYYGRWRRPLVGNSGKLRGKAAGKLVP